MEEVRYFRIILIGDSCVGKTTIMCQYAEKVFMVAPLATMGVDFKVRWISIDGNEIRLQLWDTSGLVIFRDITKSYFWMPNGFLLVFDLHNRYTFDSIQTWINTIKDSRNSSVDLVLVGNKSDLPLAVSHDEIRELSEKNNIPYFLISAKDCNQVDSIFEYFGRIALKKKMDSSPIPSEKSESKDGNVISTLEK